MVHRGEQWALQPPQIRPPAPSLISREISALCQHTLMKHTFSPAASIRVLQLSCPSEDSHGVSASPFSFLHFSTFLPCLSSECRGAVELKPSVCPPAAADYSLVGLVSHCTFCKNLLQPTVFSCKC